MFDLYQFVEECKAQGLTAEEAQEEYLDTLEERKNAFLESYYNDPFVQEGWHQQDIIDSYRRER